MHSLIHIKDFSLSFPNKTCFENFSMQISFRDRIAIIGRNGAGKSSLLSSIAHTISEKHLEISYGHVPQIITHFDTSSGGERFNKSLSQVLAQHPSMLLLDEPTNHLDSQNRKNLLRILEAYAGTLIIVTHDKEILRTCVDTLWHINEGKISIFHGNYNTYMDEMRKRQASITHQIDIWNNRKKSMHQILMKEQERTAKSKKMGRKKSQTKNG
ncbi:MAG: ATP-binding cassette domain-containing protein [Holosporales bacterium]|jgi:ATPase subunit of ABC transporter with duplicated ATPase domains|nr:ATP-binding cassette domain-containing protein [Holosporales bacterium]